MIDLNHLLNNIELYNERYHHKGLKTTVDVFSELEKERKELQLKTEKMRALCNKLCGEVPSFKARKKDTSELIEKITLLDSQIAINNKVLDRMHKKINKKLKRLHNLPEFLNPYNEQIVTRKTGIKFSELFELIEKNYNVESYSGKILKFFNEKRNFLIDETSLPLVTKCKDGYLFLCEESDVSKIQNFFLDFFEKNALSLIKVSCRKLNKANSASFYVHLNRKESFYFEINKEYFSREFNLKYRNSKIDMTKFVNQINILLKW